MPSTRPQTVAPSSRGGYRVSPYPRGRGRGGRTAPSAHRHRTLVLNAPSAGQSENEDEPAEEGEILDPKQAYVSKRDRHMQLINTSIYQKESQQRHKAIEETRKQKLQRRDHREKQKVMNHIKMSVPQASNDKANPAIHEIIIDGLRFHVVKGGSKLMRIKSKIIRCNHIPRQTYHCQVLSIRSARHLGRLRLVASNSYEAEMATSIGLALSKHRGMVPPKQEMACRGVFIAINTIVR